MPRSLREGSNARENSPRTEEGKYGFTRFRYEVRSLSRILKGILRGNTRGIIPNSDEGDLSLVEGPNAVSPGPREPGCNSFERGGASNAALNFDLDAEHR